MQTIKFSKKTKPTTEQHNLEIIQPKKVSLFGNELLLNDPCNLAIFVTNTCYNHCDFCINKQNEDCKDNITNQQYIHGLKNILEKLKNIPIEITITGGEPTLNLYRLVETMKLCYQYQLKTRTFFTTGYQLLEEYNNKPICQYMIDYHFIHNINISRMHYNNKINNQIMGKYNIKKEDIEKLAIFYNLNKASVRVSCNLLKEGICTLKDILNYVDYYHNCHINSIMFREIVGQKNIVNIKPIIQELTQLKEVKYLQSLQGNEYHVDVYEYKDDIIKIYTHKKKQNKDIIETMSLKNNILRLGYNGLIIH